MTWTYRPPQLFPARYLFALREAALSPGTPTPLQSSTLANVTSDAENFRYYRWCVRERPDAHREAYSLVSRNSIRTSVSHSPHSNLVTLYVTCRPSKALSLLDLNPHLSDIINASSQ